MLAPDVSPGGLSGTRPRARRAQRQFSEHFVRNHCFLSAPTPKCHIAFRADGVNLFLFRCERE